MNNTYHILNGDCLKAEFPSTILGEKIVARLCLVAGPVAAETEADLFKLRAAFIQESYPDFSEADYLTKTVLEIQKIELIPAHATINLWFEDDLFCQVNFWFILHFIAKNKKQYQLNLVRPKKNSMYAFAGMNEQELIQAFENKTKITSQDQQILNQIWGLYQRNDLLEMLILFTDVKNNFPFLIPAFYAHLDRLSNPGRPKAAIERIIKKLKTEEFEPVFRAFCQEEMIYGFGDLQVRRLLHEVLNEQAAG